ncbi:ATP-dependent DNA helicase HEL308 [Harpegnathos saltator]|uniref:ATP-dependent DNA helicase HEL308 n=1 Tax=Harpegnathos saltator TaxID=610380 RepID=E2C497_HARSA|nr:ATP-dependent DNA helicase HEL308 [Harpegnathos saltator]
MSDYNKEKDNNHLDNGKFEYLHSNESLLSLDNTLLCNIETDSDLHTSATSSQECNNSMVKVFKQDIKTNGRAVSKTPRDVSPDINDLNDWQDKFLMNQVYAQFDLQNEKDNISNNSNNITDLGTFDTFYKEDTNFQPTDIYLPESSTVDTILNKPNITYLHKDELNNLSCLNITNFGDDIMEENNFVRSTKPNDKNVSPVIQSKFRPLNKCNLPKKKLCLDDISLKPEQIKNKSTNPTECQNLTFYGLSDVAKKMIQEVKGICELYEWQDECLKLAIKTRKNLIYALPTSGGKTLVAEILMLREIICNKKNAIFILPYVALVQEKVQSMAILALKLGFLVEEYASTKGCYPPTKRRRKNSIYICTIEKALGLVNSLIEMKRLAEIGIIVVDELHLLGESGGRGATLEGLLTKIMFFDDMIRLIGMSATIGNLKEIAQFLNADTYSQNFRPVKITEYVKCENCMWKVNFNNEELLVEISNNDYKYPDDIAVLDPDRIGNLVMEVAPNDSCLIFCSSRKNCENLALLLTKVLPRSLGNYKVMEKRTLLNILKTEEGLCEILRKTLPFGVAYHHSGLTSEERRLLENAFKEGVLCVICCTSTLAAGVNLPARRVILRSPYVGNQFLNLSRYKQMIGRAGRAGMGVLGESILICKKPEISKVKDLLTSQMDDSLSSLHVENDRGINNLILSAIQLNMATTRYELHKLMDITLLGIQQNRLDVNVKSITDETITALLKCGVIKIKNKDKISNPNVTVVIPSQESTDIEKLKSSKKEVKTVTFTSETKFQLCDLGQAAMKGKNGPIDLKTAYKLYEDLKTAQKHLILIDNLHLLYLVTPYDVVSQITPVGNIYYDVIMTLTDSQMQVARLLGITEATANKIRDGITPKSVEKRVVERFYVTLIIHELWNHHSVYFVAQKYQVNRGVVQNLLNTVSMFASSTVRFCQELSEFWAFTEMLGTFSKKLSYCCPSELETLMELPSVKIGRARQLYKAGYKSLQSIAKADSKVLQEQIPYLSNKIVAQIIAAAKLLILQKAEDLKDECENVLDGINMSQLDVELK